MIEVRMTQSEYARFCQFATPEMNLNPIFGTWEVNGVKHSAVMCVDQQHINDIEGGEDK